MSGNTIPLPDRFAPESTVPECKIYAPSSAQFHDSVVASWGPGYTALYYLYPAVLLSYSLYLYIEAQYKIMKFGNSKRIKASLFWAISIFPMQQLCNCIAIFLPGIITYANFIATLWLSYTLHECFNLFRNLAGGTKMFLEHTDQFEIRANVPPMCCLFCLCPKIKNSAPVMKLIRYVIYQFIIVTIGLSVIQAALTADHNLYQRATGEAASSNLTLIQALGIIKALLTLLAMWGFTLQFTFIKNSDFITERYALKGKRWSITIMMIINGILPFVFSVWPIALSCKPPFDFVARSRIFECFLYLFMIMMVQWLGTKSFVTPETITHCCILFEDHIDKSRCPNIHNTPQNRQRGTSFLEVVIAEPEVAEKRERSYSIASGRRNSIPDTLTIPQLNYGQSIGEQASATGGSDASAMQPRYGRRKSMPSIKFKVPPTIDEHRSRHGSDSTVYENPAFNITDPTLQATEVRHTPLRTVADTAIEVNPHTMF